MNESRQQLYHIFYELFAGEDNCEQLALDTERGCYQVAFSKEGNTDAFWGVYSDICYKVSYSLSEGHVSESLWEKLRSGTIAAEDIALLSSEKLNPEANADIRDEIERRRTQKIKVTVCALYKCPKCGRKETSTLSYQAASADEGSTTSIKCLNETCGHVWRQR